MKLMQREYRHMMAMEVSGCNKELLKHSKFWIEFAQRNPHRESTIEAGLKNIEMVIEHNEKELKRYTDR